MAKLGTVERHYSDEAKQNARLLIVVKRDGTVDATAYARKKPSGARSGGGTTGTSAPRRSEEHTSELQSLMRISYAVFCLKKKNNHTWPHTDIPMSQVGHHALAQGQYVTQSMTRDKN